MDNSWLQLRENEEIIKKCSGHYFPSSQEGISVNILHGEVLLTTDRIIFFYVRRQELAEFPLSKIVNVSSRNLPIRGRYNTICIDFENGGSEFFSVDKPGNWIETINLIKSKAPNINYSTRPFISGTELIDNMEKLYANIVIVTMFFVVIIISIAFLILGNLAK